MSAPRALLGGLDELRERVKAGHHDYSIMLAGGNALSRKTIYRSGSSWRVRNHIDETLQDLSDIGLWDESNIGEALDKGALIDMAGDDGLFKVAGQGIVNGEAFLAEARETRAEYDAEHPQADPLRFTLDAAPGAIRMGTTKRAEWQPADPELLIEVMDIGPATVAQIDLGAVTHNFSNERRLAATTSIELTIEDIDGIVATLLAIKQDAIDHRRFVQRADGWWTNGRENE